MQTTFSPAAQATLGKQSSPVALARLRVKELQQRRQERLQQRQDALDTGKTWMVRMPASTRAQRRAQIAFDRRQSQKGRHAYGHEMTARTQAERIHEAQLDVLREGIGTDALRRNVHREVFQRVIAAVTAEVDESGKFELPAGANPESQRSQATLRKRATAILNGVEAEMSKLGLSVVGL